MLPPAPRLHLRSVPEAPELRRASRGRRPLPEISRPNAGKNLPLNLADPAPAPGLPVQGIFLHRHPQLA